MRRHLSRTGSATDESEINLTPMLDVVFIMLIFFIVTTSFVKESGIDVNRPSGESAERKEQASIIISVSADGEIWIDKKSVDLRSVKDNLVRLRAENPMGSVVVAADKETRTGTLIAVVDQVRLAGVDNPAIATESEAR